MRLVKRREPRAIPPWHNQSSSPTGAPRTLLSGMQVRGPLGFHTPGLVGTYDPLWGLLQIGGSTLGWLTRSIDGVDHYVFPTRLWNHLRRHRVWIEIVNSSEEFVQRASFRSASIYARSWRDPHGHTFWAVPTTAFPKEYRHADDPGPP